MSERPTLAASWTVAPNDCHTVESERAAMATMISEVYDALKSAGAPEEQARKAAEVVAGYENRFARIDDDLTLLKWMVGFNLAVSVGIIVLLLRL